MSSTPNLKLIFVDDEKDLGKLSALSFRSAIASGAIEFHFFASAQECLSHLSQDTELPALVITDINMPEVSGFELLDKIRGSHPNIDVFMMSAYNDSDSIEKSFEKGAKAYFTKPISFKNIKARIQEDYGVTT